MTDKTTTEKAVWATRTEPGQRKARLDDTVNTDQGRVVIPRWQEASAGPMYAVDPWKYAEMESRRHEEEGFGGHPKIETAECLGPRRYLFCRATPLGASTGTYC